MTILSPDVALTTPVAPRYPAQELDGPERCRIALRALNGQSISRLAHQYRVSRKFVTQQRQRAQEALDQAFQPPQPNPDVLFHLPVTRAWIRQLVLALVLTCHSPYRGVTSLLQDLFDYPLSIGSVHHILHDAVGRARLFNQQQDLSNVRFGLHDEIFQASLPVLVGVDAHSTYCYLLSQEEHRDADTWGVRLLELTQRGFSPQGTCADAAAGLRCGQEQALPGVPCQGDVFHALREVGRLVRSLESRAYQALDTLQKLHRQQARHEYRQGRKDRSVAQKQAAAGACVERAMALADDVGVLAEWLQHDILAVNGLAAATRRELLAWVMEELEARQQSGPAAIASVCTLLENQGPDLLVFATQLDETVVRLARQWQVSEACVRALLDVEALSDRYPGKWAEVARLRAVLGSRYHGLSEAVAEVRSGIVRASSLVENLNSQLRSYFFLRRQVGPDYLTLLQCYLNHRRYLRSECPEREGKSPAELLTGEEHPHWLELLGYQRFSRN